MAHRAGWKESKLVLSPELDGRLRMLSLAKGHSVDTVLRTAVVAYAKAAGIELAGGQDIAIKRRRAHTLVSRLGERRVWFTFPDSWHEPLRQMAMLDSGLTIAGVVRSALVEWLPGEEASLAEKLASVADDLHGPASPRKPRAKKAAV
jgi:hypothetical protein